MLFKSVQMKADEAGKVSGFFSTYDKEPDSYGDIIEPGAFTGTFERRKATGHPFPMCFNHDFDKVIGAINEYNDQSKGFFVDGDFIETQQAQDVRTMVKSGAIYQFSFAYDILRRRDPTEEEAKAGVKQVLQELEVYEISIVTVPANRNAVMTDIKSMIDNFKAGRRNSKADKEIIKNCIESLKSLIDDDDEDNHTESEEKSAEPTIEVNETSEEPKTAENAKRAEALLEKINSFKKEVPNNDD